METIELSKVENKEKIEQRWAIILHNDNFNTFNHVIKCLMKYCKHNRIQAEQCAHIVHFNGKTDVNRGDLDTLLPIHKALIDNRLSATLDEL